MGNNMCSSQRRPVADRFTRPQRLLRQPSDVDYKKLKKLIRSRKLAPCFDAVDDPQLTNAGALEECPICFLYYPSLNRSRCCGKGICTECFLQMKPSHTARTAQCPFCKAFCYAVEFHGARTEEEKSLEQAEEQKYIEAKIRMQSEPQIEEKFMPGNRTQSAEVLHTLPDVEESSREQTEERDMVQHENSEVQERTDTYGVPSPYMCWSRHHEFDTDLEEIMMMEATWKSLQDSRSQMNEFIEIRSHSRSENLLEAASSPGGCGEKSLNLSLSESIAVSIARLAEHSTVQQTACEPEWEPNRTNQSPQRNFVRESNSTRLESGHSSGSYLSITEQPCI